MATAKNSMQPLFKKLQACGFNSAFVKKMLPDWWDDSIADTPSGLQQATLILAQLLAIRPDSLWHPTGSAVFALPESRKFKRRSDVDTESLDVACALAFSAARIVQTGLKTSLSHTAHSIPGANALRQMLLTKSPWIGLAELLDYCFSIGIPVIYLHQFPGNTKKMDGLAFDCQGHAVIVLTKRTAHGGLLFDLAHELGHIALNHLKPGGCIIDQEIDAEAKDNDERAANNYALELLTGKVAGRIDGNRQLTARQQQPGGNAPSDQEMIRQKLFANLDREAISDDDLAVLTWLVGKDGE